MKKSITTILGIAVFALMINAQNDTLYILNSGLVIGKYNVKDIDSIVFYAPEKQSTETISDIEGNVYNTVTIGNQVWMSENLKTTKYNDGSQIPKVIDANDWFGLGTPAYCWLDNDSISYRNVYGALYNWYAVETEKLCPAGWHVPTDVEWNALEVALGMAPADTANVAFRGSDHGSQLAGNSLSWTDGSLDESESFGKSGFNALGAGSRAANGGFNEEGFGTFFWTSSINFGNKAWGRNITYQNTNVYRLGYDVKAGMSVRCIKD